MRFRWAVWGAVAVCHLLSNSLPAHELVRSPHAIVVTVHPQATDAGLAAFEAGGNAIDAAAAAAFTLGVVDSHNSGLGGGCFILARLASGQLIAIDGREKAPAAATRDMYLRDGRADTRFSQTGPLAVGVPGALAAYDLALRQYGALGLSELLLPAAEIAEQGFVLNDVNARVFSRHAGVLRQFEGTRAALLKPNGAVYKAGEVLRQPDLARTYRAIAQGGAKWFYRGEFATSVAVWMQANGGVLTAGDFAEYEAKQREPVVTNYRGFTIVGFPPPSSGGIHVAQILNILENFDLAEIHGRDPAEAKHFLCEAMKLAFADRAHWLGDADFVRVPRGLVDKTYARELAKRIDPARVTEVARFGQPSDWQSNVFGKHTTHIATADTEGNWVAITATVNTSFGSKVIVPGTGVVLNNELDDFSAQPGVPNAFGLIGAENNAVAPGKRPLSSMSPTVVLQDGQPVLTVGAAGGPKIITQVVLALVRCLDYGQPLDVALRRPRLHHQWKPDVLMVERGTPAAEIERLMRRGHTLRLLPTAGVTQAIMQGRSGDLIGVHDPRVPGKAAAWIPELQPTGSSR